MSVQRNDNPEFEDSPQRSDGLREPYEQPIALVVDDEPLVRHLICSVLSRLGWRTHEAASGAEALRMGADTRIDLLITDFDMPGIKGTGVAAEWRRRVPHLPVVVVSGDEEIGQLAGSRGYRFLAKPFDPPELSSLVTALTARQMRDTDGPAAGAPEVATAVQTTRIPYGPARSPGRARSSSGLKPRPTTRDDADRPIGTHPCTLRCFPADDPQFDDNPRSG